MTATATRWEPKVWEVNYEEIVIASTIGLSNEELAKKFNFTPQHISNILQTPQAALTRRRILDELQKRALDSIPQRMTAIADKAVQRLHNLLHDDERYAQSPFAVVDRGLQVLKGVGVLREEKNMQVDKAIILTGEQSTDLLEGLVKANRAKDLNKGIFIEAEVIEDKDAKSSI